MFQFVNDIFTPRSPLISRLSCVTFEIVLAMFVFTMFSQSSVGGELTAKITVKL
jgi:hypothetical protein